MWILISSQIDSRWPVADLVMCRPQFPVRLIDFDAGAAFVICGKWFPVRLIAFDAVVALVICAHWIPLRLIILVAVVALVICEQWFPVWLISIEAVVTLVICGQLFPVRLIAIDALEPGTKSLWAKSWDTNRAHHSRLWPGELCQASSRVRCRTQSTPMWRTSLSRLGMDNLLHRVSLQKLVLGVAQRLSTDLHVSHCNLPTHNEQTNGLKGGMGLKVHPPPQPPLPAWEWLKIVEQIMAGTEGQTNSGPSHWAQPYGAMA